MAFHENLRVTRLAKGMTQPQLAERAQIEQSYLSKLENGRSSPSDEVLKRLADALELPAEELLRNGDDASIASNRRRAAFAGLALVVLAIGAVGGWFAHDSWRTRASSNGAPDRSFGSLTERLHGAAPSGVKIDTVDIDEDGSVVLSGRTVDRQAITAYLGELRRGGIGEADHLMLSDSDTRFHLRIQQYTPAPMPSDQQRAAFAAEHTAVMARLERAGLVVERMDRSPEGSYYAQGKGADAAKAQSALEALAHEGYAITSQRVEGDATSARFELSFHPPGAASLARAQPDASTVADLAKANRRLFEDLKRHAGAALTIESLVRQPDGRAKVSGSANTAAIVSGYLATLNGSGYAAALSELRPHQGVVQFDLIIGPKPD